MADTPGERSQSDARYFNYFKIGHNAFEFVFDFGQHYEDWLEPALTMRMITSPIYAKSFYRALGGSLAEYEAKISAIKEEE